MPRQPLLLEEKIERIAALRELELTNRDAAKNDLQVAKRSRKRVTQKKNPAQQRNQQEGHTSKRMLANAVLFCKVRKTGRRSQCLKKCVDQAYLRAQFKQRNSMVRTVNDSSAKLKAFV